MKIRAGFFVPAAKQGDDRITTEIRQSCHRIGTCAIWTDTAQSDDRISTDLRQTRRRDRAPLWPCRMTTEIRQGHNTAGAEIRQVRNRCSEPWFCAVTGDKRPVQGRFRRCSSPCNGRCFIERCSTAALAHSEAGGTHRSASARRWEAPAQLGFIPQHSPQGWAMDRTPCLAEGQAEREARDSVSQGVEVLAPVAARFSAKPLRRWTQHLLLIPLLPVVVQRYNGSRISSR